MKISDYKSFIDYISYSNMKYINPDKAGPDKEKMETIKKSGQAARKIFTEIAKSFEEKLEEFKMQKVSGWMNQAQICRPYFWIFLKKRQ